MKTKNCMISGLIEKKIKKATSRSISRKERRLQLMRLSMMRMNSKTLWKSTLQSIIIMTANQIHKMMTTKVKMKSKR